MCSVLVCGTAGAGAAVEPDSACCAVRGTHLAVRLVPLPDPFKNEFWLVAEFFTRAPDSTTWFGPNGPQPVSWLTSNVYCKEMADFEIDIADQDGEYLESLQFRAVQPGFYRILTERVGASRLRGFKLRFRQVETVIRESRIVFRDEE
jgi:hypothetical protein